MDLESRSHVESLGASKRGYRVTYADTILSYVKQLFIAAPGEAQ